MDWLKLGIRNLQARRSRTVLTVLAIGLGVSIMIGVNMGSDMIVSSLAGTLDRNLGKTDVVCEFSWQGIKRAQASSVLASQAAIDAGVDSWVPRFSKFKWNLAVTPAGNDTIPGLYSYITGIDTTLEHERDFGKVKVEAVHPGMPGEMAGTLVGVESLLEALPAIARPVVLTTRFLQVNQLVGNISPGDILHVENDAFVPEFPLSTPGDPSTWPDFTVVAIVEDVGEMFFYSYFNPYSVFMKLAQVSTLIFNQPWDVNIITHALVHLRPGTVPTRAAEEIRAAFETMTGVQPFTYPPKDQFLAVIAPALNVIRIFFTAFAAISLVVCGVLIKNLFEMAKQTDIHEIGILKGIGYGSGFVAKMYAVQILVMAAAGTGIGFATGTGFAAAFVEILKSSELARTLLRASLDIQLFVSISPASVLAGLVAGFAVPFAFGMVPVIQTARVPVIDAIQVRTTGRALKRRTVTALSLIVLGAGIALTITGVWLVQDALGVLFARVFLDFNTLIAPLASLFVGIVSFLFGLILAGVFALPAISKACSWLFLATSARALKDICHRNVMRNKRRTVNTFMMVVIGLSFMVTITTITSSISAGAYPGKKTVMGGDIRLGEPRYNYYSWNMTYDQAFMAELELLPTVKGACLYRFAVDLSRVEYNLGFIGTKIDNFGYHESTTWTIVDGAYSSYTYRESLSIGIVDPVRYHAINEDAILRVDAPAGVPSATLFQQLATPYTIMLQSALRERLGKQPGDTVRVIMDGIAADLVIVGYASILPGFPWTMGLGDIFSSWGEGDLFDHCGVISWATYNAMLGGLFQDIDLVIKHKFRQTGMNYNSNPLLFDTLGFPINTTLVDEVLAPFIANGSMVAATPVLNNFLPVPSRYRNDRPFQYHVNGTHPTGSWNPLASSTVALPGPGAAANGIVPVVKVHPDVPVSSAGSVEAILDWYEGHGGAVNACIVSGVYAHKTTQPFDTYPASLASVYTFDIGDTIRIGEPPMVQDFTVVAIVGSNANYAYHVAATGENVTSPATLNPKTLNVNAYRPDAGNPLYMLPRTVFMDANAVFLHRNKYLAMTTPALEYLETLGDWEVFPGINITSLDLFSEMLAYKGNEADLANLIYIKAGAGVNVATLRQQVLAALAASPATANHSVVNPRHLFLDATIFDKGNAWIGITDRATLLETVDAIERLHDSTGRAYISWQVSYFGRSEFDLYTENVLSVFTSVFTMVMVIALAISLLGLAISMITSIYQRQREIGTLRAVGFSRRQVLAVIFGEAMTLGLMGILIGFVAGLVTASIMIAQVPFLPFLAIIYTPPYQDFVTSAVLLGGVMLAAAIIPARASMRLDIAGVLRAPE